MKDKILVFIIGFLEGAILATGSKPSFDPNKKVAIDEGDTITLYIPYALNVDEYPEIAKKFGIMSIPTLVFFKAGLEHEREIGYRLGFIAAQNESAKIYNSKKVKRRRK